MTEQNQHDPMQHVPGGYFDHGGNPVAGPGTGNGTPAPQGQVTIDEGALAAALEKALGGLTGAGAPQSFKEVLADVDPRDSDAALEMLDWLLRNGRLNKVGVLDGGQGYLFVYQEPKGSSKQGYIPGGTQGDRIVDEAVQKQRDAGAAPKGKSTMCKKCFSAVIVDAEGNVFGDDPEASAKCSADGGAHDPA